MHNAKLVPALVLLRNCWTDLVEISYWKSTLQFVPQILCWCLLWRWNWLSDLTTEIRYLCRDIQYTTAPVHSIFRVKVVAARSRLSAGTGGLPRRPRCLGTGTVLPLMSALSTRWSASKPTTNQLLSVSVPSLPHATTWWTLKRGTGSCSTR
jgi:hypothetical protein